ncbi:hypothetical protein HDV01_001503 [Terramyces sp. JEL0728]|nr:hypothetical protein HDV01_001503 [Terramyces sp. JEL0728]
MEEIRKDSKSLPNRVKSIIHDAKFVEFVAERIPQLPIIPNERAGCWYANPNLHSHAKSVYFKSTDGHFGQWDFNLKRMNFHILQFIGEHRGGIIVDVTRKGKRFPDSLSKTIPIWCAVINSAVSTLSENRDWDAKLHTSRAAVSESEASQIEERIPKFVSKLLSSSINLTKLKDTIRKPLRPIWIHPSTLMFSADDTSLFWSPEEFDSLPFYPIICLSASISCAQDSKEDGAPLFPVRNSFSYIQGAADDSEMWAPGITYQHFWEIAKKVTENTSSTRIEEIFNRVKSHIFTSPGTNDYNWIGDTGIAIGNRAAAAPPKCWDEFDFIINCGAPEYEYEAEANYLYLDIPEGKKGQNQLFNCIKPLLSKLETMENFPSRLLVHCMQGKDRSVGVALSILIQFNSRLSAEFEFLKCPTKESILNGLLIIQSYRHAAAPTRATMKKINLYFIE